MNHPSSDATGHRILKALRKGQMQGQFGPGAKPVAQSSEPDAFDQMEQTYNKYAPSLPPKQADYFSECIKVCQDEEEAQDITELIEKAAKGEFDEPSYLRDEED